MKPIDPAHPTELPRYRFSLLGYGVGVLITLLGAVVLALRWDEIPAVFATHFGDGFEPDGWSEKSIGSVFFGVWFSWIMLAVLGGTAAMTYRMSAASNLQDSAARRRRAARIKADTVTALGWVGAALSAFIVAIGLCTALPGLQSWIKPVTAGGTLLLVVGTLPLVAWSVVRASNAGEPRPEDPETTEDPDRDKYYKWGVFYYNPDDPAVLVEKRYGIGLSFNYARPQAQLAMATLLLLPLLALLPIFL